MRRERLIISTLAMLLLPITQLGGQTLSVKRTTEEQKELLHENKPSGIDAIKAPEFALSSNNGNFIMALGGFIKPTIGWDIGNTLNQNMSFTPTSIPVPSVKGQRSEFFFDALQSGVDLQMIGLPNTENQIVGYAKIKFNGNGSTLKVKSLYIKYRGFLIGLNSSLFEDAKTSPTTISSKGVAGCDHSHATQLSYISKAFSGFSFGAGIALPSFQYNEGDYEGDDYPDLDGHDYLGKATQRIPDVLGYLQYGWGKGSHVRASGVVRNFQYMNKYNGADELRNTTGWGAQLSTIIKIGQPINLLGQAIYGKGIGSYISDLGKLGASYIPRESDPGGIYATPMMGWFAGVRYFATDKIMINATFGMSHVWDCKAYSPDFRYGIDVRGSIFYQMSPWLGWAVEYIWGQKNTYVDTRASINRIQAAMILSL